MSPKTTGSITRVVRPWTSYSCGDVPAITFPFMRLSTEVRLMIYEYLLAPEPIKDQEPRKRRMGAVDLPIGRYWPGVVLPSPEILATCKQINDEAKSILYKQNVLRFPSNDVLQGRRGIVRTDFRVVYDRVLRNRHIFHTVEDDRDFSYGRIYPHVIRQFTNIRININLYWELCRAQGRNSSHLHLRVHGGYNMGLLLQVLRNNLRKADRGQGVVEVSYRATFERNLTRLFSSKNDNDIPDSMISLQSSRIVKQLRKFREVIVKVDESVPETAIEALTEWYGNLSPPLHVQKYLQENWQWRTRRDGNMASHELRTHKAAF